MTIDDIILWLRRHGVSAVLYRIIIWLSNSLNRCNFLFTQFKIRLLRVGISHDPSAHRAIVTIPQKRNSFPHTVSLWVKVPPSSSSRPQHPSPRRKRGTPRGGAPRARARAPDRRLIADAIYRTLPVSNPRVATSRGENRRTPSLGVPNWRQ